MLVGAFTINNLVRTVILVAAAFGISFGLLKWLVDGDLLAIYTMSYFITVGIGTFAIIVVVLGSLSAVFKVSRWRSVLDKNSVNSKIIRNFDLISLKEALRSLDFRFSVIHQHESVIVIALHGLSWKSLGEIVVIEVLLTNAGKNSLRLNSDSLVPGTAFDFGINARNVRNLLLFLNDSRG